MSNRVPFTEEELEMMQLHVVDPTGELRLAHPETVKMIAKKIAEHRAGLMRRLAES